MFHRASEARPKMMEYTSYRLFPFCAMLSCFECKNFPGPFPLVIFIPFSLYQLSLNYRLFSFCVLTTFKVKLGGNVHYIVSIFLSIGYSIYSYLKVFAVCSRSVKLGECLYCLMEAWTPVQWEDTLTYINH